MAFKKFGKNADTEYEKDPNSVGAPDGVEAPEGRGGVEVEVKYIGTEADRHDMAVLGRKQVLRRNFQFVSMVGFASVLIATWELLFVNLLFNLTDGGTGGIFWGYTVVIIAVVPIYLSIAEMASMSPTAGGQYHWVSEYAPPWCQKYLSYITGWVVATGWNGAIVGLSFAAGTIVQGLIILNSPSYEPQQWHGTLLVIGAVSFAIVFNTVIAKQMPLVQTLLLVLHLVGAFAVIVPLLAMGPAKNSARVALLDFQNAGGWPSMGTATMVGLLTALSSMLGFDCAVHMSEEIRDASTTLPKAILYGVALNALLGYLAVFTICFTVTDYSILDTDTIFPFIQLFYNTTGSLAATNGMSAIIIATMVFAVVAEIATASRQIWSFARDNGLPFSKFLSKIPPKRPIPFNAVVVCFALGIIVALINLGSSTALNAIVSLTISALLGSYILSIGCILSKRLRGEPLPASRFSLGHRTGAIINSISLVFLIPFFIFCFFPTGTPVDRETMNWNIAMFGGIFLIANVFYIFKGRKTYVPPVRKVKRDI